MSTLSEIESKCPTCENIWTIPENRWSTRCGTESCKNRQLFRPLPKGFKGDPYVDAIPTTQPYIICAFCGLPHKLYADADDIWDQEFFHTDGFDFTLMDFRQAVRDFACKDRIDRLETHMWISNCLLKLGSGEGNISMTELTRFNNEAIMDAKSSLLKYLRLDQESDAYEYTNEEKKKKLIVEGASLVDFFLFSHRRAPKPEIAHLGTSVERANTGTMTDPMENLSNADLKQQEVKSNGLPSEIEPEASSTMELLTNGDVNFSIFEQKSIEARKWVSEVRKLLGKEVKVETVGEGIAQEVSKKNDAVTAERFPDIPKEPLAAQKDSEKTDTVDVEAVPDLQKEPLADIDERVLIPGKTNGMAIGEDLQESSMESQSAEGPSPSADADSEQFMISTWWYTAMNGVVTRNEVAVPLSWVSASPCYAHSSSFCCDHLKDSYRDIVFEDAMFPEKKNYPLGEIVCCDNCGKENWLPNDFIAVRCKKPTCFGRQVLGKECPGSRYIFLSCHPFGTYALVPNELKTVTCVTCCRESAIDNTTVINTINGNPIYYTRPLSEILLDVGQRLLIKEQELEKEIAKSRLLKEQHENEKLKTRLSDMNATIDVLEQRFPAVRALSEQLTRRTMELHQNHYLNNTEGQSPFQKKSKPENNRK